MKSFERLVLTHLKDITGHLLDPLQFAYRANRSVDDAVNMGLHFILQHLDHLGTYARILFLDCSLAFNTIVPDTLSTKLSQLTVSPAMCQWITIFSCHVSLDHQLLLPCVTGSPASPAMCHWITSFSCHVSLDHQLLLPCVTGSPASPVMCQWITSFSCHVSLDQQLLLPCVSGSAASPAMCQWITIFSCHVSVDHHLLLPCVSGSPASPAMCQWITSFCCHVSVDHQLMLPCVSGSPASPAMCQWITSFSCHVSVDHQLPDRQDAAGAAGENHVLLTDHQQWCPSGMCTLFTALLSLHQ
ncbi:uncharacterized protein LOC106532573 isoform X7 [Austrofundulus limnaeus]|uniref:Uncharacterized protein LOC106532573 isoform X7 n=1 Tax=Austrofundulus limnaeus TaxID=52670 RepID=A0A2I4CVV0_AUSLI|nr:PREDICTED: uncharacterized protein LOC106532573 isoform X7 [Austrofundulus limnaeus]